MFCFFFFLRDHIKSSLNVKFNNLNTRQKYNLTVGAARHGGAGESKVRFSPVYFRDSKMAAASPPTLERMTLAEKREGRRMEVERREIVAS